MNASQIAIGQNLDDLRAKLRARMEVDHYFNVTIVFGHSFLDSIYHKNLAQFIWNEEKYPRSIILGPRGGGKTLIESDKLAAKWLLNPSETNLVTSYNLDTAIKILNTVKEDILTKQMPRELFPDLVAALQSAIDTRGSSNEKVTEKIIRIPRFARTSDAQFKAGSINTGITSAHVSRHSTDDLIDEKNARSGSEIKRAIDWIHTSFNIMEHQVRTPWSIIGTHYNLADPYVHILKELPMFTPFVHPGLIINYDTDGNRTESSYWPSRFTVEELHSMRSMMGSHRFAALIQQNPTQSDDATFKEEWIEWYEWDKTSPTGIRSIRRLRDNAIISLSDMNIFMIFDPALGRENSKSRNALLVLGIDAEENIYTLATYASKNTLDVATKQFIAYLMEWQPDLAVAEEVLFQSLILPAITKNLRERALGHFPMKGVSPKGRSKDFRILALQPFFEQRRVFLHRSQDELIHEILVHPNGDLRDLLDAMAYGPDVWYAPRRSSLPSYIQSKTFPWLVADKKGKPDPVTGY